MVARHLARLDASRTRERAGRRMARSRAMIPMTTNSSTSVKARGEWIALERPRVIWMSFKRCRRPRYSTTKVVGQKAEDRIRQKSELQAGLSFRRFSGGIGIDSRPLLLQMQQTVVALPRARRVPSREKVISQVMLFLPILTM